MDYYVGYKEKENNYDTINEVLKLLNACPLSSDEDAFNKTFTDKAFPAPNELSRYSETANSFEPVTIHINKGVYRERLVVTRPYITFEGEGRETEIVYGLGAFEDFEDGNKRGTFRTASVRIDTHDFTAKNISFVNDAGVGSIVGQALALYVDGDRNYFENCYFLANQDTLFTAPLPEREAQPGGFRGPGELHERVMGRHLYRNCYISGNVDFIFGSATCWFEDCVLFSNNPKNQIPENKDGDLILGYVTAASTKEGQPFGYVFNNCKFESDCPKGSVYLGRPWREYAKTVLLNCELGEHIHPAGWHDWEKNHEHFYYAEYKCSGPGADISKRADFSHQLSDEEAKIYTLENVLGDWKLKI